MPKFLRTNDPAPQAGKGDDDSHAHAFACSLAIMDRLIVMKRQERTIYHIDDYLNNRKKDHRSPTTNSGSDSSSNSGHIDTWCRCKMVLWCFSVVDYLQFDRETVCIAMSFLDRFLSSSSSSSSSGRAHRVATNRREYQLASMTALYMAIKLFEPKVIDMMQLTALSQGSYERTDFVGMELDMLFDLEWHLHGPTATSFLLHYITLLHCIHTDDHAVIQMPDNDGCGGEEEVPTNPLIAAIRYDLMFDDARYQIELSVMQYKLVTYHPSRIAAAALVNAIQRLLTSSSSYVSISAEQLRALWNRVQCVTGIDPQSSHLQKIATYMNKVERETSSKLRRRMSSPAAAAMIMGSPFLQGNESGSGSGNNSNNSNTMTGNASTKHHDNHQVQAQAQAQVQIHQHDPPPYGGQQILSPNHTFMTTATAK